MYNGTPFETPLPCGTPISGQNNTRIHSDSENNVCSSNSENAETVSLPSTNGEISLVAEYDDIIRIHNKFKGGKIQTEETLSNVIHQVNELYINYFEVLDDCKRMQSLIDDKTHQCSDLEHKLQKARKLLDAEKWRGTEAHKERDDLVTEIDQIRHLIFKDKSTSSSVSDEVKSKLNFLQNNNWDCNNPRLSAINEVNTTGSILSEFSYSHSEDDLNGSVTHADNVWKKHRPSSGGIAEPSAKKRRSSGRKTVDVGEDDTIRATTTLTLPKNGPITATSVIESVPRTPGGSESTTNVQSCPSAPPADLVFESWARASPRQGENRCPTRQHCFQSKTVVMPDHCGYCERRIGFGRTVLKCKECKTICHVECKDNLPLPCIPMVHTPTQRHGSGVIGDYTPSTPPMVPALLIHCINEIELRGLNEEGLYMVSEPERDVKALKEKFLKGRGVPCLSNTDIHVICGVVKDFLRCLNEPLTTYARRQDFIQAVEAQDPIDVVPNLCQVISHLPQPNRDTLAYMIFHLQKVSEAKTCSIGVNSLAKVFGPSIVGYPKDVDSSDVTAETVRMINVMEHLINVSSDYWSNFINVESTLPPSRLQQVPSTDSLLRPTPTRGIFVTPKRNKNLVQWKQKYFASPKP